MVRTASHRLDSARFVHLRAEDEYRRAELSGGGEEQEEDADVVVQLHYDGHVVHLRRQDMVRAHQRGGTRG